MDQCDFPKCRNLTELMYIGRNVCCLHWEQLCSADSTTEKKLLRKIYLVRNDDGVVILIRDRRKGGEDESKNR
jgi:hypothetical protein